MVVLGATCPLATESEAQVNIPGAFELTNLKGKAGLELLEAFNNFRVKLSLLLYRTVSWTSSLGDMLKHSGDCPAIVKTIE